MTKDSTVYAPTTFELAETADCRTFFIKQHCQVAACSKFIVYILNSRQNTTRLRDLLEFRFVTNFDSLTNSQPHNVSAINPESAKNSFDFYLFNK